LTTEQRKENGKKAYAAGLASLNSEQHKEKSKKAADTQKRLKNGFFKFTKKERKQNSAKGGKTASKITNTQKWQCTETGFITNPGALTRYQKSKGIDTTKRIRIE